MLPKQISGRYKLQKELRGQSSSEKGLYIDRETKKMVFIKIDCNSKSLFREYLYQQFFYEESRRLKTKDILIPKPLEIIKTDNYAVFVMEYFYGKSLVKADVKKRLNAYMRILKFLEKINTETNIGKKYGLKQKSAAAQLVTLPYFFLKNLILYPNFAFLFLRSVGLIARKVAQLTRLTSNWICHGDINTGNALLYRKKIILIDFSLVYKSHRYFDISRALNSAWYKREFHGQFWNRIVSEFRFTTQEQDLLKSFVILNLMQRLSQRYSNPNQERFYLKRLETTLKSL